MKKQRGGPGRGQGRKPIKEGQDTVTVSLRMTTDQRDKLARLGGAEWVRQRIDKAKTPNAIGQGSAACGASPAPTGCAANGTNDERTEK
jgi:hypothetical protein